MKPLSAKTGRAPNLVFSFLNTSRPTHASRLRPPAVSRELHPGAVPGHPGRAAGLEKGGLAERPFDRDGPSPPDEPPSWWVELQEPAGRRGGGRGEFFFAVLCFRARVAACGLIRGYWQGRPCATRFVYPVVVARVEFCGPEKGHIWCDILCCRLFFPQKCTSSKEVLICLASARRCYPLDMPVSPPFAGPAQSVPTTRYDTLCCLYVHQTRRMGIINTAAIRASFPSMQA